MSICSKTDGWIDTDITAQSYPIKIPSYVECISCTVRLQRQALEWGKRYKFWSCSDVDIVYENSLKNSRNLCIGEGRYNPSFKSCFCPLNRFGSHCQHKKECIIDADCMNGGRCINIMPTGETFKHQCFCLDGYFGSKCERKSSIRKIDVGDLSEGYQTRKLSDRFQMFWKINQQSKTMRVVLKAKTNSYVALGWRPKGTKSSCQAFPHISEDGVITYDSKINETTKYRPKSRLHPMDCTDMVIGMARHNYSKVYDAYTRDRSTPQPDHFYGGA